MKKRAFSLTALLIILVLVLGIELSPAAVGTGSGSTLSGSLIVTPGNLSLVLAAPSDLTVSVSGSEMSLNWKDNSSNESGFEIERTVEGGSYSKLASVGAGITTYKDSGLASGTRYYYRVRAYNNTSFSAYTNEASAATASLIINPGNTTGKFIPPGVPVAPQKLNATAISDTEINLAWVDASDNETGFKLYRKSGSKPYVELASIKAGATAYKDSGLLEDTSYTYQICAFNVKGNSSPSNEASAQTAKNAVPNTIPKTIKYYIGQTTYYVNGQPHDMDVAPEIINDCTYIPLRYVAEPLGATITWDFAIATATCTLPPNTVAVQIDNCIAKVNGVDTQISIYPNVTPLLVPPGRVLVPAAFVAHSLGCQTIWDGSLQEVTVIYPKP
ncbi:MAG TPA: stalk domain-containing protein [Syntrophomonadaceae bacterium]|nr:stalk domain-containing protein [Syntrophomonadaceae bacterium]